MSQHIAKLKKQTGGKATTGKPLVATQKAPATPKKPTLPKTPTSSVKRKRDIVSDDDNDDNDSELDLHTVKLSKGLEKRNSLSRPGKNPTKKYEDPGSEVDADGEDDDEAAPTQDDHDNGEDNADTISDIFKNEFTFDGAAEPKDVHALTDITNGTFSFGGQARMFARGHARKSATPGKKRAKTYNDSADESDVSNFSDIIA